MSYMNTAGCNKDAIIYYYLICHQEQYIYISFFCFISDKTFEFFVKRKFYRFAKKNTDQKHDFLLSSELSKESCGSYPP